MKEIPASSATSRNPWLPMPARIREITPEIDGVVTYRLELTDPVDAAGYRFRPGQFNMMYLPGAGEAAISLSGDPVSPESLIHTVRTAGNVTRGLAALRVGDTIGLRGPYGSSWPVEDCLGRDVVIVTGGIGLPPLRPLIYTLLARPEQYGRLHLLYGARTPETQMYPAEYDSWIERGLMMHTTVDRSAPGYTGNVGVVPLLLDRLKTFDPKTAILLACGPEIMMRYTARTAFERGLSPEQIWISTERNMQCAIGMCGHCQLGPAFICKDGPVFRYDKLAPYMKIEGL